MKTFPNESKATFQLPGPSGQLEVLTSWPQSTTPDYVAIICHPHPQQEGTMHNKVVTTVYKACDQVGMATVRFNFRGVGASSGQYGEGVGEQEDLLAVCSWVTEVLPHAKIILAGFSFGSFIAANVAQQIKPVALVTVAPAVHHQAYELITAVTCPWLVIAAENDEIVPLTTIQSWLKNDLDDVSFEMIAGSSHFFHGCLLSLRAVIVTWLQQWVT